MPFNYPDALKSIGASMLVEGAEQYTPEMIFLRGAVNCLNCMGGPNYNPGTTSILNRVFDEESPKEAVRFLCIVKKISWTHRDQNIDYRFFWNLFKERQEDLSEFKKALRGYVRDDRDFSNVIPERLQNLC
jgi:hypothetical protein